MKIVVVLIISSIVLSSAQPSTTPGPMPSSPECMQAVSNLTMDCQRAYFSALVWGNATDDQTMMVCNATRTCNGMLEFIINACSDIQSSHMVSSNYIAIQFDNLSS